MKEHLTMSMVVDKDDMIASQRREIERQFNATTEDQQTIAGLLGDNSKLRSAGAELIAAIEKQLAYHGKGIEPSDRVKEAIAAFKAIDR